jgi:hypothetical protein
MCGSYHNSAQNARHAVKNGKVMQSTTFMVKPSDFAIWPQIRAICRITTISKKEEGKMETAERTPLGQITMDNGGVTVIVERDRGQAKHTIRAFIVAVETGIAGYRDRRKLGTPTVVGVWPGATFLHKGGEEYCPSEAVGLRIVEVMRLKPGYVCVGIED